MATKQTAPKSRAPKGFKPIKTLDRCDGWWSLQEGNVMQGIYLGFFEVKNGLFGPKKVIKFKVTNPEHVMITDPDDKGKTIQAEEGQIIGVDEKGFLKSIATLGEGEEVWFSCVKKEPKSKKYPLGCWVFDGPCVYSD